MTTVPNMISTKDLSYISDMFNWNFIFAKKCLHFSNEVTDQNIKNEFINTYQLHFSICNKLISILGGSND